MKTINSPISKHTAITLNLSKRKSAIIGGERWQAMLIVLLVMCIAVFVLGKALESDITMAAGVACGACMVVVIILMMCSIIRLRPTDSKILMHETENQQIEKQISIAIENYQAHEKQIFESVSPDSAIVLMTLYPELKSDKLIATQIETYIENNNRIRELKSEKLNEGVYRWWLYFGK